MWRVRPHRGSGNIGGDSFDRAIVVGASIAGLLTARVLADHFGQVTIVDRDVLRPDPVPRAGVPQSRHLHAMLPRGLQIIEAYFPGLSRQMQVAGAVPMDTGADIPWLTPQGWGMKVRSGLVALSSTRDFLECHIRRRVKELGNVEFCPGTEVTGLLRAESGRIIGVRTRGRNGFRVFDERALKSDLVVIASGRQSTVAKWFSDVSLEVPPTSVIDAHIGYASRIYRRSRHYNFLWQALILQPAPPGVTRGGLIFAVEDDQWQVTLLGGDRDYPPTDESAFLEFARSLRSPELYDAIRDLKPLTPISGYRSTENRRYYFERVKEWPEGLIVTGDAACAFNPVYGQGMTAAALEAAALSRLLMEYSGEGGLGRAFQAQLADIVKSPWTLATSADLRFLSVQGAKAGFATRLMHRYVDRVLHLGTIDAWARQRFLEVQGMMREVSAILKPDMLWRVAVRSFGYPGMQQLQ